ncbi:DUF481 domain-containing protein [Vibrio genomosp. F10]|uniref:DUF481 domain-containing protein n=1 Tax=Vibrio genomosp. F10 TaxID=723171 RepID=UPI001F529BEF|nr:DUF481 domain-containing protein [Vibrio genomosp. F10]
MMTNIIKPTALAFLMMLPLSLPVVAEDQVFTEEQTIENEKSVVNSGVGNAPVESSDAIKSAVDLNPTTQLKPTITVEKGQGWVQLVSGEVLLGSLTGTVKDEHNSYELTLEFDSEELGDVEIDVEDIAVLQTADIFRVRLANGETHQGQLTIADGKLTIQGDKLYIYPVSFVVSVYSSVESEIERWETDLFLGANFSKGNTDELSVSAELNGKRQTVYSRTLLKYNGNITQSSGEKTAQNHQFNGSYDIYLSNRLFFRPIKMAVNSDKFQNIDYRVNASMQMGYFIITQSDLEWDVSLGPGFQTTQFDTVLEGQSTTENSPIVVFSSDLEYELTKDIDVSYGYDLNWANAASGGVRHSNDISVDVELVDDLDFSVKFIWDHNSNPKVDSDGVIPNRNDYKLNVGLTFDF